MHLMIVGQRMPETNYEWVSVFNAPSSTLPRTKSADQESNSQVSIQHEGSQVSTGAVEDYGMADHKVILEHNGFVLTGVDSSSRWDVTITSASSHLLALVPQNTNVNASSKAEAFDLARDTVDCALRPRT